MPRNLCIVLFYYISLFFVFMSCGTSSKITEVPVTLDSYHNTDRKTVMTDSVFIRDTVYVKDSIYVKERGDTVFVNKFKTEYRYSTKFRYITKYDTVSVRDSIPYPVTITEVRETVTNKLTWFQQTLFYIGGGVVAIAACFVGYLGLRLYIKKHIFKL